MSHTLSSPAGTSEDSTPPSRKELAFYASGVASTGLANGVLAALTLPVFNMILGLNPAWIMKVGGAIAIGLSGWVLVWTGFDVQLGGAQADGVFFNMRLCFSIIPSAVCLLALAAVRNWPLTRTRCEEIQSLLAQKREAAIVG